jgi:trans-2,3-dihydro-3-hydroxyanthranilate isomerase
VSSHPFFLLDVFAERPLEGNGLAVVLDADEVDDATMLAFARETRLAETTFVQSSSIDADYRNRIWTVVEELPFAGHPTLGTAVAVAAGRELERAAFVQETRAGLQRVAVECDDAGWRASTLTEPAREGETVEVGRTLAAVGLTQESAAPELEPRFVSVGLETLLVPLRSADDVAAAKPDRALIAELPQPSGTFNLYLFALGADGRSVRARSLPTHPAEAEDPATGSAAAALCAYLAARARTDEIDILQGVEIGRPSRLHCRIEGDRVRLAGRVHVLVRGEVFLPLL